MIQAFDSYIILIFQKLSDNVVSKQLYKFKSPEIFIFPKLPGNL